MQMEFSHGDTLYPILAPLFLGGGDTIMIHGGPTDWTEPWQDRRDARINFRTPATHSDKTTTARSTRRHIQQRWADMLVRSIHHAGFQARAIWAQSSMFKGSGRWLSGPGGAFYGRYTFRSPLEYTMSLRMRLLLPPASSDVGAPGPFLCSCGSTIDPDEMPFHCLGCSNSQFFNIHRHHAVRDTTIDLLNAVASTHTSILSVLPQEPLVLPPNDTTSFSELRNEAIDHIATTRIGPRQSVTAFRTSRAYARNSGQTRADTGFITSTNRRYIDMTDREQSRRPLLLSPGLTRPLRPAASSANYLGTPGSSSAGPEACQVHRQRLAQPLHFEPFLYSDRRGHCALQRYGRPCMGAALSPLLSHLGGRGCGVILPLACAHT